MKKPMMLLSLPAALLLLGAGSPTPSTPKAASPSISIKKADHESVRKYIPMEDGAWVGNGLEKCLANRNDAFWNGRSFNALDRFYRGEAREGQQGTLVSPTWVQSEDYITFTLGGHAVNSFVGIFNAEDDVNDATPLARVDNNEWFIDPSRSCNMGVRFIDASNFKGKEVKLALVDRDTSGFGFLNFGALQVNQTKAEVASTIDLHKNILVRGAPVGSDAPANSNDEARAKTLEWYKRDEYKPFIEANGTIDRYNLDFEMEGNHLELFGSDTSFEGGRNDLGFFYDLMISDRDSYWWNEHMPFNKTGNRFLCSQNGLLLNDHIGESNGDLEANKFRMVSPLFTLSGSGFLSLKMGGATAALQILDENNTVLSEVTNPAFVTGDNALANVMETQVNMNTMVRTVVDASAYLGKKIRVGLVDKGAQDGVWSYPNFDELVTYYESVPSFRLDKITQTWGDPVRTYYGERLDYFVAFGESKHPEAKEAYDFLFGTRDAAHPIGENGYYSIARAHDKQASFCSLDASDLRSLVSRYDALTPSARALVDASQDYQHLMNDGQSWFDVETDATFTVGQSMSYIRSRADALSLQNRVSANFALLNEGTSSSLLAGLVSLGLIVLFGTILFHKRKKQN